MRFFLFIISLLVGPYLMASGFTIPQGVVYTKIDYKFLDADQSYDNKGNRVANQLGYQLENDAVNYYIGYGLGKRFSLAADIQYLKTVFDQGTLPATNEGITDIWVDLHYALYRGKFNVVANAGVKLPQQKNQLFVPYKPALTSGEEEYSLGLGFGHGATAYFLEADLGYVWRPGFVAGVRTYGVPYENSWEATLKAGWHIRPKLDVEGILVSRQTVGDIDAQFIPGVFANSDETRLQLSLYYLLTTRWGLGVYGEQTLAGKNILHTDSIGCNISYRWSR